MPDISGGTWNNKPKIPIKRHTEPDKPYFQKPLARKDYTYIIQIGTICIWLCKKEEVLMANVGNFTYDEERLKRLEQEHGERMAAYSEEEQMKMCRDLCGCLEHLKNEDLNKLRTEAILHG